jgi:hypothetical protein
VSGVNFITHKTPTSYEYQANCASRCSASKVCTVRAESARSLPLTVLSSLAEAILNRVKSSLSFDSSNGIFDLGRWLQRRSNARYNARYNARTSLLQLRRASLAVQLDTRRTQPDEPDEPDERCILLSMRRSLCDYSQNTQLDHVAGPRRVRRSAPSPLE